MLPSYCLATLIVRVIYSTLEWTDFEGNPINKPNRITGYCEFRPTLSQAEKGMWLELDQEHAKGSPLDPRFKIDEDWLKVWALQRLCGENILFEVVKLAENGESTARAVEGIRISACVTWTVSWQSPSSTLRYAAKKVWGSAAKLAIEAELTRRKTETTR